MKIRGICTYKGTNLVFSFLIMKDKEIVSLVSDLFVWKYVKYYVIYSLSY